MTELEMARYLDKQHPNMWKRGGWYPASLPNGITVELKRTNGKGRHSGRFLHARRKVRLVVRHPDGTKSNLGHDYVHVRFNLRTGECKEL